MQSPALLSKCRVLHPDATAVKITRGQPVKPEGNAQPSLNAHLKTAPSPSPFPMQSSPQILTSGQALALHTHFADANPGSNRERVAKPFCPSSHSLTHPMPDHQRQRRRRVCMRQRQGSAGPRQESDSQEPQGAGRRHLGSILWPRSSCRGPARAGRSATSTPPPAPPGRGGGRRPGPGALVDGPPR